MPSAKDFQKILLAFAVFTALNLSTLTAAGAIYPAHFQWFFLAFFLGNLLWVFVPKIFRRRTSTFLRWVRALLGPPWFTWTLFMVLFNLFLALDGAAWVLRRLALGPIAFADFSRAPADLTLTLLLAVWLIGMAQALFGWHVARVQVPLKRLPKAFHGFKVAMLSDLHVGLFTRASRLRQFVRLALAEKPDLLVIAGDITDDNAFYIPKFLKCLSQVPSPIPRVAILGNHDLYGGGHETIQAVRQSALRILVNEGFALRRGKASLWVAGLSDYAARRHARFSDLAPDLHKTLRGKPKGAPTLLLAHQPQAFEEAARHRVELTLSGHTHGGQLGLRFLDWSLAKAFTPWHMGHFKKGDSHLYVTVGTGFWMVPFRFGLPPEISLLELRNPAKSFHRQGAKSAKKTKIKTVK
ncbi:MAG TPA: metallophosphoesterase [bacterium]|nr:metallophosphoesterase [bacterium]